MNLQNIGFICLVVGFFVVVGLWDFFGVFGVFFFLFLDSKHRLVFSNCL